MPEREEVREVRGMSGAGKKYGLWEGKNTFRSKSLMFMTELILAILFFSAAAAVCLQAYAGAAVRNQKARRLKQVLNCTENLVQQMRSGGYDILDTLYPLSETTEDALRQFFFDGDGNSCRQDEADYYITLQTYNQNGTVFADLEGYDCSGESLYGLQAALYPDGGADG